MNVARRDGGDFRPDINGLRAVAVAIVVLFHFAVPGFQGGFVGVDVFFVISGFLMTKIIASQLGAGTFSLPVFYLHRARRIFPALAVLCAALLLFGWLSLEPRDYRTLALHAAASLAFVSNFTYLGEAGYFDTAAAEKWLLHTWSLSVEWQFYLVFPLGLMLAWRFAKSRRSLLLVVAAAFAASLLLSIKLTANHLELAYYMLPTRAWQMLAGGLVYFATDAFRPGRVTAIALELTGLGLIIASAVLFSSAIAWPSYRALAPVAGACCVLLARRTASPLTTNPAAAFLGDTSYSIYLWHWPVAVALTFPGLKTQPLWQCGGIALVMVLAYASWRWVERPARARAPQASKSFEWAGYAAAASLLIAVSLAAYRMDGFTGRLHADAAQYREAIAATSDWQHPGTNCKAADGITDCEQPGRGGELVMFIGDSIAEQWYPRYGAPPAHYVEDIAFLTRPGCTPVRNVDGYPPGVHCNQRVEHLWDALRDRKPRKLVVSSMWWANYFYPDGTFRGAACIVSDAACRPIASQAQLVDAFSIFEADVAAAVAAGVQVYIIGPIPSSHMDYAQARLAWLAHDDLLLPLTRHWLDVPTFAEGHRSIDEARSALDDPRSRTPHFHMDAHAGEPVGTMLQLLADLARRTGAKLIDVAPHMCPQRQCALTDSAGAPLYKDAVHLRAGFVRSDGLAWLDDELGLHRS